MASVIRTKRLSLPARPEDGLRLFIARYRPRGVALGTEDWHAWEKRLAPSAELLDAFHGKQRAGRRLVGKVAQLEWPEYRRRFLDEMGAPAAQAALDEIARWSADGKVVTLLCYCEEEERCHRSLVRDLLAARELRPGGPPAPPPP